MSPAAIRTLRRSQKLTQAGFAALLGTRQATVSDWERDHNKPCPMALNSIQLLQLAQDMAADLEAVARGATWVELCAAPSEPALVEWRQFIRARAQP